MLRSRLIQLVGVCVALLVLAFAVLPAMAAGTTQVNGEAVFGTSSDCPDYPAAWAILAMDGDLEGCWYIHGWDVVQETPSGIYQERGTETFVGCMGTVCGSFDTTYKFTAKFAADGSELHGRCQHPIEPGSGTGGFEGATGRVDFKDDVETGIFYYRGHIKLGGAETTSSSSSLTSTGGGAKGC